jgi:hypothetical protein
MTWGVAPHWDRPAGMFTRVALAGPDRPSVRRASRWRRTRLGAALLDATGGPLIVGIRLGKGPDSLVAQRRSPGGAPQATEVIARHGGHGDVLAATSPDGRPMVAWAPNDRTLRLAIRAVP